MKHEDKYAIADSNSRAESNEQNSRTQNYYMVKLEGKVEKNSSLSHQMKLHNKRVELDHLLLNLAPEHFLNVQRIIRNLVKDSISEAEKGEILDVDLNKEVLKKVNQANETYQKRGKKVRINVDEEYVENELK